MRQRNAALNVSNIAINKKVEVISAGIVNSLVLDESGALYRFGHDISDRMEVPTLRDNATRFTTVSAGHTHHLALDDQGNLYAWGRSIFGLDTVPLLQPGATRFTAVSASPYFSMALDDRGNLYAWGWTHYGQTNIPALIDGAQRFTTISAGTGHALALDDRGNLYAWGENFAGESAAPPLRDGASTFTAISAGGDHSLALDDRGNLYAWGWNEYGQTTAPSLVNGSSRFTAISAGHGHSLALDDQGNAYAWGWNDYGQTSVRILPEGAARYSSVSAGGAHSLAVDDQGNLYAWGWNHYGQTNIPSALSPVYARSMPIAMGGNNAFGIEDTGRIEAFTGTLGAIDGSDFISVATGPRHALAITRSGTVVAWGDYEVGQLNVPGDLNNVIQVVAGYAYSAALRADGSVEEWGSHTAPAGRLVTKPDDLPKLRHLAGGLTHILGITVDGGVVAWGDNSYNKATPPDGLDDVIAVAANGYCSAALRENGELVYWGSCHESFNERTSLEGATTIAMSDLSMAAIVNGQIIAWGEDANELLAAPAGLDYVAVSAGTAAFLAVTSDGTVATWGSNYGWTIAIPESFGGPAPNVNDELCDGCEVENQEFQFTDEMIRDNASFYAEVLTPEQRATFIEALGGSSTKPMTPDEIQALVDKATAAEREAARKQIEAARAQASTPAVITTLPAAKSPFTKVGATVSTRKAVSMLGLKRVTRVSFVKPRKPIAACTVTATRITAKTAGTCNVRVRYRDSKKKVRTTTLSLSIG